MGQLNLKDDALIEDAKALAALLGTSTTEAVRRAVRDRLQTEQAGCAAVKRERFERLMAIAAEAPRYFPAGTTSDHGDLYDEHGLPR